MRIGFPPPSPSGYQPQSSQGDLMALYQQILAAMQGQPLPSANTEQYDQMMKMYQQQMGQMGNLYQQLGHLNDPKLGNQQYDQMRQMNQYQLQLNRDQQRQYMQPVPRSTITNAFGY